MSTTDSPKIDFSCGSKRVRSTSRSVPLDRLTDYLNRKAYKSASIILTRSLIFFP